MAEPKVFNRSRTIIEKKDGEEIIRHYGEMSENSYKIRRNKNCRIYMLDYCKGVNFLLNNNFSFLDVY